MPIAPAVGEKSGGGALGNVLQVRPRLPSKVRSLQIRPTQVRVQLVKRTAAILAMPLRGRLSPPAPTTKRRTVGQLQRPSAYTLLALNCLH